MAFEKLGLASFAAIVASTSMVATSCEPPKVGETEKVKIAGTEYTLKTAMDDKSRTKGLGGVDQIDEFGGMIFVFPNSLPRSFWMYGCTIDLDIAFLDPLGIVTAVHTMPKEAPRGANESDDAYGARLKRYSSVSPAQFAIELRPGSFQKLGIKRGSKIDLDLPRLKAAAK
jgi:uncharacterized membrane protein (UPF0127 family)